MKYLTIAYAAAVLSISLETTAPCTMLIQQAVEPPAQQAEARREARKAFPGSARVGIYPPRPVAQGDGPYLAWICGATGPEAGVVQAWVSMLEGRDTEWFAELFEPLREPSSDFVQRFAGSSDHAERAKALETLMKLRDQKVEALFSRERELLWTMTTRSDFDESAQVALVDGAMLARRADAFRADRLLTVQLTANILRLLHAAATDPRTGAEAGAAVRQIAMDQAPAVCEQRRMLMDVLSKSGYRGIAAKARAVEAGSGLQGAMASVFRPIAFAAARTAAMNREIVALAKEELPAEVGDQLEQELLRQTYGPLASDMLAYESIEALLLPMISEAERAAALDLIREDKRSRTDARIKILRLFDREQQKFLERGMGRDPDSGALLVKAIVETHSAGRRGAEQTIQRLREMAQANPAWKQDAFEDALGQWKVALQHRIAEFMASGETSGIVPDGVFARDAPAAQKP